MPKIHSIRTKIVCSIVLFALVISTVLVCVSYFTYKSTMDEHYDTLGNNVAQTAISMIDEDVMLEYSRGVAFADPQSTMASQEYQSIITTLDNIKESNNVLYLYIIYPTESGSYFIFDTDHSKDSCPYGYYMEYYEGSFSKIAHRLVRGETVPAVISNKDYGWIISISHPYISSGGELIGYVCVDISMEQVVRDRQAFLLNCILVMAVITVIFAFVYMFVFNKIFVGPIKQMTTATAAFVSDRGDDDRVLSPISLLKVKTNDELQTLCESLKKMELDLNLHIDNLKNITAEKERIGAELNVATHIQESMLQYANTTYQGKYIFGGCHNDSAPFSGSGSRITYAATDVTSGQTAALDTLSQEKACVDIGLGLNDGPVSDSNTLNTSIPGIAVLGYGVTPDGISKNLIALTGQMSELLKSSEGDWVNGGAQRFKDMMSQYEDSLNQVIDTQSAIGVQSQSLEITASRLNDLDLTYNTQIVDVEYVNDAEAISEYYYAQYTYNAALRVGSSILGPSLLDFLK